MSSILEHYKVLGVSVGAGMADVTSSYKRLCRIYHPDINDDPESEELMKKINIAYTVLRDKLKREAAFRERQSYTRPARRYTPTGSQGTGSQTGDANPQTAGTRPQAGAQPTGTQTGAQPAGTRPQSAGTRPQAGAQTAGAAQTHTASAYSQTAGTYTQTTGTRSQAGSQTTGAAQATGSAQTQTAGARATATNTRARSAATQASVEEKRKSNAEEEKQATTVLSGYFSAISTCDYSGAYDFLSSFDRQYVTRDSFIEWRRSVARLFPMREFNITGGHSGMVLTLGNGKTLLARKYMVVITEEDVADERMQSGDVEKMVICEDGIWKVFLGYKGVTELTRGFDERFEEKRKNDYAKRWEEYYEGLYPEFNMLSLNGMRKAVSREMYRQKRFGGVLTFAAISVRTRSIKGAGQDELLYSAARTIVGVLRETDVPAYIGDGVFTIIFVGLKKKNAEEVISRLTAKIRRNAGTQLGGKADFEYAHNSWAGNEVVDFESINSVLVKFRKKL